jgi:hypothetical protein
MSQGINPTLKTVSGNVTREEMKGELILVDTTAGDVTLTLPIMARQPDTLLRLVVKNITGANNTIVNGNGTNIDGVATRTVAGLNGFVEMIYDGVNGQWRVISEALSSGGSGLSLIAEADSDTVTVAAGIGTAATISLATPGARGSLLDPLYATFAANAVTIVSPGEYDIHFRGEVQLAAPSANTSAQIQLLDATPTTLATAPVIQNAATSTAGDVATVAGFTKLNLTQVQIDAGVVNVLNLNLDAANGVQVQNCGLLITKIV